MFYNFNGILPVILYLFDWLLKKAEFNFLCYEPDGSSLFVAKGTGAFSAGDPGKIYTNY